MIHDPVVKLVKAMLLQDIIDIELGAVHQLLQEGEVHRVAHGLGAVVEARPKWRREEVGY